MVKGGGKEWVSRIALGGEEKFRFLCIAFFFPFLGSRCLPPMPYSSYSHPCRLKWLRRKKSAAELGWPDLSLFFKRGFEGILFFFFLSSCLSFVIVCIFVLLSLRGFFFVPSGN
ncbi:hypothetical protein PSV09DRAFT_2285424, partial [Bipolaris maydis]|uniref:uncharacterized protein n=1 Tax=Cochliobolus heterostrophus TaxID=5016 RepID=UPI0024D4D686